VITDRQLTDDVLRGKRVGLSPDSDAELHGVHIRLKREGASCPRSRFEVLKVLRALLTCVADVRRGGLGHHAAGSSRGLGVVVLVRGPSSRSHHVARGIALILAGLLVGPCGVSIFKLTEEFPQVRRGQDRGRDTRARCGPPLRPLGSGGRAGRNVGGGELTSQVAQVATEGPGWRARPSATPATFSGNRSVPALSQFVLWRMARRIQCPLSCDAALRDRLSCVEEGCRCVATMTTTTASCRRSSGRC
jgi:hypothetical protein